MTNKVYVSHICHTLETHVDWSSGANECFKLWYRCNHILWCDPQALINIICVLTCFWNTNKQTPFMYILLQVFAGFFPLKVMYYIKMQCEAPSWQMVSKILVNLQNVVEVRFYVNCKISAMKSIWSFWNENLEVHSF